MAAIVSQLAAANRRRKANKKNAIPIEKSVYVLPPFDPCFKPEVHNRYIKHKQAHLAHQEFIARIGTVSPVHIHQLEQMGTQRMKTKRAAVPYPDLDPQPETEKKSEVASPLQSPPKRGAQVVVHHKEEVDEAQVELRLLDEETLQASAQQSSDNQSSTVVTGIKCQLVIALLGLLALIPLIGIVVYLVGMFINVPDTQ